MNTYETKPKEKVMNSQSGESEASVILAIALVGMVVLGGGCFVYPKYQIYQQTSEGEAEYQKAESNRKIAILEAEAKLQAAKSLAAAEVERAKGVAEANKIIGDSLQGNDAYLRYLWISELKDPAQTVIYVPTEANLPILEASRKP